MSTRIAAVPGPVVDYPSERRCARSWHGRYRRGARWLTVLNKRGDPIAYASEAAALAAAKWELERGHGR